VSVLVNTLAAKRLELLHELVPTAATVGLLVNPRGAISEPESKDAEARARTLGLPVYVQAATSEREIDAAFASFDQRKINALFVTGDPFFVTQRHHLVALAARYALPTSYSTRESVEAGGLFFYGSSQDDAYRQLGTYAGRILKGEKPVDLPVLQPSRFEVIINLKTAKALGLTVPSTLLIAAGSDRIDVGLLRLLTAGYGPTRTSHNVRCPVAVG
jgi:putative ABC transport system substrate-binding protein